MTLLVAKYGPKPVRSRCEELARQLILKYPFTKDDLGSGYVRALCNGYSCSYIINSKADVMCMPVCCYIRGFRSEWCENEKAFTSCVVTRRKTYMHTYRHTYVHKNTLQSCSSRQCIRVNKKTIVHNDICFACPAAGVLNYLCIFSSSGIMG